MANIIIRVDFGAWERQGVFKRNRQSASGFSLKTVLFVCFTLVAALPVLLLTGWFQQQSYEYEQQRVHEKHLLLARNITGALERYARDVTAATVTVAQMLGSNDDPSHAESLLDSLDFNYLALFDSQNQPVASVTRAGEQPRQWPRGLEDLRQQATAALQFSAVTIGSDGQAGIWLTQQYGDAELLVAVLNTDYFRSLQAAVSFGEKGHAVVLDQTGAVIAHPNATWVARAQSLAELAPVAAMRRGEEGVSEFYSPAIESDVIAGFSIVPSTGWGVMVPQPLVELKAQASKSRSIAMVVASVGVLSAIVLAWLLSAWVTRPVRSLATAAKAWNGSQRPEWLLSNRVLPRELAQLNQAFAGMSKRITQTHAELKVQAEKDGLTGLTNRTELQMLLEQSVKGLHHGANSKVGLLYVDLDRFKAINDSMGHAFGDEVLRAVAERLQVAASEDVVARVGGDEFLVMVNGFVDRNALLAKATNIVSSIQRPFEVGSQSVQIDGSVGIAVAPDDAEDADLVLRRADMAMYHAKRAAEEHICFYAPYMQEALDRRQKIEQKLRKALNKSGLQLAYQPRVNLKTGHATSVEALLRWPEMEADSHVAIPDVIEVAEHAGLMGDLGRWVLACAFRELENMLASDGTQLRVSVNLSASQFGSYKLAENLLAATVEHDFDSERLEIEITETTAMANVEQACQTIENLRRYGVTTSIDDFGTGYSSLSYLKRLPVASIKVDQGFVRHVERNANDRAIVKTILSLCKTLDIPAVAEGVETKGQLEILQAEGCTEVQGYWFAEPMRADDLAVWLEERADRLGAGGLRQDVHLEETFALSLAIDKAKGDQA